MAGTITYSNPGGQGALPAFASGKIVADGAETNVICGFMPSAIEIYNDTHDTYYEWFVGIPAGSMIQRVAAGDSTLITSGPVVYGDDLTTDTGEGWTLPATAAINTASDVLYWRAWR